MKKSVIILFIFAFALLYTSNAWAQKATASYYGGVLKYQKYEPWYYRVLSTNKKKANKLVRESLASIFTHQTPKQEAAYDFEEEIQTSSNAVLTKKAAEYFYQTATDKNDTSAKVNFMQDVRDRYNHLAILLDTNLYTTSEYELLELDNENTFYLEASPQALELVEYIIESEPKQRSYPAEVKDKPRYPQARPEPKSAFETPDYQVVVTFDVPKREGEMVQLVFDTQKMTLQIFNKEFFKKTNQDHDLMELKPWH